MITPAGHALRSRAKKGVRREWQCERCTAVLKIPLHLSVDEAAAELRRLADLHGGASCP